MVLTLTNQQARRILIDANGLSTPPTGPLDLAALIHSLGYVQIDTIRNVTRAHHHILWSRNQNYREPMIWEALQSRKLFEHFTHDASLLPIEFYPYWHWQFERMKDRFAKSKRWNRNDELCAQVVQKITDQGALSTHAFDTKVISKKENGKTEMWARPPHKRALDYMWYTGELTTCHRKNFIKHYDLSERAIPQKHQRPQETKTEQFQWLCREALKRLVIAAPGELQDFWGAASAVQIKSWLADHPLEYIPIKVATHNGGFIDAVALPDIEDRLRTLSVPTSRLRILNPFDPLIRNRKRLERVFGFEYRIEIFVPAAKRRWGYYVYPLLEGEKLIGRLELSCDRKAGNLSIANVWPEANVKWTDARQTKLDAELKRFAKLAGVKYFPSD